MIRMKNENEYKKFDSRSKEYRQAYYNFHKERLQEYQREYYKDSGRQNSKYKINKQLPKYWKGEKLVGGFVRRHGDFTITFD